MLKIIQNSPNSFQSEDTKTFNDISGFFKINNNFKIIIDGNNIIIDDINIVIYKNNNHIGGNIWLSSLILILYLQEKNKNIFNNKKILELGAGTALLSMYISKISTNSIITASDYDISITNENIINNNLDNIITKKIDWNNLDNNDLEKYDIIILSDCIYRTTYKSLLLTIKKYLKPKGKIFISNADRENVDEFIYGIKEINSKIKNIKERLYYNDIYYIDLNIII
jgi:2-polyprenyl-3-methyl-5-hydroxy-6-metoxy-1,4-benzoquinol methylase